MRSSRRFTTIVIIGFVMSFVLQSCNSAKSTQNKDNGSQVSADTISTLSTDTEYATDEEIGQLYSQISKGGEISVKEKIYHLERVLLVSNQSNLTLDGNGSTFVMKDPGTDVVIIENSQNVKLRNFKATHIEPTGPVGCTGNVIQVRNNTNIIIENCELNGSGIIGVTSYDTKNLSILNNYIHNNSLYGILFDSESTLEIRGNRFKDNGGYGNIHVVKAMDPGLNEVGVIEGELNMPNLKMSGNDFK